MEATARRDMKSVYSLRDAYYEKHPHGHFFDPETLKFFGESWSSMRLLKRTVHVTDISGDLHECYVLSSLQRRHPSGPRRRYTYFDVDTLEDIMID